jgi:hypothetical protein
MYGFLINYHTIPKTYEKILNKIGNPPESVFTVNVIFLMNSQTNEIYDIEKMNTDKFIGNIVKVYFTLSKNQDICELIFPPDLYFPKVLDIISSNMPQNAILWVSVDVNSDKYKNKLKIYAENGFRLPYIITKSPLQTHFPEFRVALIKQNKDKNIIYSNQILLHVDYIMEQSIKPNCNIHIRLNNSAINFLKKLPLEGIKTTKSGELSQKEISGSLFIDNIDKIGNKIIFTIDVDKKSISSGEQETVIVQESKFNFHSHPKAAYIRHSVEKAWPSNKDYNGFVELKTTIFHCVSTLEGLYIISFTPYWCKHVKNINKNFIQNKFNIDHNESYTPEEYVSVVNNIKYKNKPLFNVIYIPWNKANTIFNITYAKNNNNCFPFDENIPI